ncbi:EamA family transporter [Streptomyces sp. NPDC004647]|uniref:EamA family transporter n=1 Tax=Streptomyces sp. NPDC004647 TaxID=3154671 RepID=UPI0033BF3A44
MGELLALSSAVCFGSTHFVNGLVSRRAHGMTVALYAQIGGTALSVIAASAGPSGAPGVQALGYGALSGLGTGVGVAFLYRAMSKGAMSVVVPLSDVGAVALPVLVGLAFLGERPPSPAVVGVVGALPAIWLVSGGSGPRSERPVGVVGVGDALVAGVGFAAQYLAIARVPVEAGLWPVVASRVMSVAVVAVLLWHVRGPWRLPSARLWVPALAAGAVGTVALVLYLAATQQELMAVATVLSALYPVIPVVLALVFLHERVSRGQALGLAGAGTAIALIALQ